MEKLPIFANNRDSRFAFHVEVLLYGGLIRPLLLRFALSMSLHTTFFTGSSDESVYGNFSFSCDQTAPLSSARSEGMALSDQALLLQAFSEMVSERKSAARDWLIGRVEDINLAEDQMSLAATEKIYSAKHVRNSICKLISTKGYF